MKRPWKVYYGSGDAFSAIRFWSSLSTEERAVAAVGELFASNSFALVAFVYGPPTVDRRFRRLYPDGSFARRAAGDRVGDPWLTRSSFSDAEIRYEEYSAPVATEVVDA